ncbi:MAG: DUF72 domain-containing protein [Mangrovimonas sp.]|nr:DUF72 domain-containing protein [Mangrovimonas sp.]
MKFGSVDTPENVDFSIPADHPGTKKAFEKYREEGKFNVYVGCAKWNKADLKGFYPRGVKDELEYYATQFNSIELNATFYRIFPPEQFEKWHNKTPDYFKFFPKLNQEISHWKRLEGIGQVLDNYLYSAVNLKEKLGSLFLQMHNNFAPKDFARVVNFVENWPKEIPLAVEFRHTEWYNDPTVANELYNLLESNNISNVLVDTAGRRDLMHMRMTNGKAFVRYVGANHASDYMRLDAWVDRLKLWKAQGINEIDFFIHQNIEKESPLLASHFIKKLNQELDCELIVPTMGNNKETLF